MAHKADQILDQIETLIAAISGLTAQRSKFYANESDQLPRVIVGFAGDERQSEYGNDFIDSVLNVELLLIVDETADAYESALAEIRKDINIALLTDHTLGLSFVIDSEETNAQPAEVLEGNQPRAMQSIFYSVLYRRNRINPEN